MTQLEIIKRAIKSIGHMNSNCPEAIIMESGYGKGISICRHEIKFIISGGAFYRQFCCLEHRKNILALCYTIKSWFWRAIMHMFLIGKNVRLDMDNFWGVERIHGYMPIKNVSAINYLKMQNKVMAQVLGGRT